MEIGWIIILKELDYEKRDNYQIKVVVLDYGEKVQLFFIVIVDVIVIDVNDSFLRFTVEIYKGIVSEDDLLGGVIVILSITDVDFEEINR